MARRTRRLLNALIVAALSASACGGNTARVAIPPASTDDTTLGPGDVFDVRVFGEEALSGEYRIAQDGSIDFPLVGRVEVGGLEPTQVAETISTELRERDLLLDPQVSIFVREYVSKRISVVGAVENPGAFPLTPGLTVVQVISLAGGFAVNADRNSTTLSRSVDGERRRFRIRVDEITRGRQTDIPVGAGDIIHVPRGIF